MVSHHNWWMGVSPDRKKPCDWLVRLWFQEELEVELKLADSPFKRFYASWKKMKAREKGIRDLSARNEPATQRREVKVCTSSKRVYSHCANAELWYKGIVRDGPQITSILFGFSNPPPRPYHYVLCYNVGDIVHFSATPTLVST